MSKYPVRYFSASKNTEMDIEGMPTPHLINAWRKLKDDATKTPLLHCMNAELVARGCTLDPETGRWTLPPKPEVTP